MGTFGKRKSTDMHVTKDEVSEGKMCDDWYLNTAMFLPVFTQECSDLPENLELNSHGYVKHLWKFSNI